MGNKHKNYTEDDAVTVARLMLKAHHDRRLKDCIRYFSEDMIWVGPFKFQRSRGIAEYIRVSASEYAATPIILSREEYYPICLHKNLFLVYGRYYCSMFPDKGRSIHSYPRFGMLLKEEQDGLKVCYLHASLAYDQENLTEFAPSMGYYEYIGDFFAKQKSTMKNVRQEKMVFKDIDGNHRYLSDYEIIHVQGEKVYSRFFTIDEDFLVRISLKEAGRLCGTDFCRVHKSHLVNSIYVRRIIRYELTLFDGTSLPVSRENYGEIKNKLALCL